MAQVCKTYPGVTLVLTEIDRGLESSVDGRAPALVVPGIGDFADRYFGTESSHDILFRDAVLTQSGVAVGAED